MVLRRHDVEVHFAVVQLYSVLVVCLHSYRRSGNLAVHVDSHPSASTTGPAVGVNAPRFFLCEPVVVM